MLQQTLTPVTPLEAGVEMFQRSKGQQFLNARTSFVRPMSEATEFLDTDEESEVESDEESAFEEDSPRDSFNSVCMIDFYFILEAYVYHSYS